VRWITTAAPVAVHHCHCRICQRWTGSAFATLAWFKREAVSWTGQEPMSYGSSPIACRTHCPACGTPIHLDYDGKDEIALAAGSADEPGKLEPTHHYGAESRLPWANISPELPSRQTRESW
jgi:hypothetical protein